MNENIPISVRSPKGNTVELPKVRGQNTTSGAHAEVDAMYTMYSEYKVRGGDAELTVIGC